MKYVVGIDLGTTHTALAYAPLGVDGASVDTFSIPQLVSTTSIDARPLLPSFFYVANSAEGALPLPWDASRPYAVGEFARTQAALAPGRVVSSAKSWLCHAGVDRRSGFLPLHAPADVERISPVDVSRRYLEHLIDAWNTSMARDDKAAQLQKQEIILTVPASFDPAARELTVLAAESAGFKHVTLLEEPQAALYAWISMAGERWRKEIKVGDVLLVVDVGGGTTDFSAIVAVDREGSLELVRVAVGEHILLGGDNMDLALAYEVRAKLKAKGKEIDQWQMVSLTHMCRTAKERMLSDASITEYPIALVSRGSKLLGDGIRTELTRDEVSRVLLDGFFPEVSSTERPAPRARSALTHLGLPYASDAAIPKHLAGFLGKQADALTRVTGVACEGRSLLHPSVLLFNGGVMKGTLLRERLVRTVGSWLQADGGASPRVLEYGDLDLAVARGAAAYGLARQGRGLRIRGGTAKSYYVGIESAMPAVPGVAMPISALCVAPFGLEEGSRATLPTDEFGVVIGEPVRFRFFSSTTRRTDSAGAMLERWAEGELEELSPIEVTLPAEGREAGNMVPVRLAAEVTEVGTLRLEAVATQPRVPNERWRIELGVREEA